MPELLCKRTRSPHPAQWPIPAWWQALARWQTLTSRQALARWQVLALCAASMGAFVPARAADPVPAGLRACGAETDPGQRLACFDRELARYPAPAPKPVTKRDTGAPATAVSATALSTTGGATAGQAAVASPAATSAVTAASTVPTAAAPAATTPPSTAAQTNTAATAAKNSQHVSAHIVSIDPAPGEMVLHLDNGQIWQQVQGVSGDLSLRPGDTVTIERHLGSYWLSGPHVSNMKVRQKI